MTVVFAFRFYEKIWNDLDQDQIQLRIFESNGLYLCFAYVLTWTLFESFRHLEKAFSYRIELKPLRFISSIVNTLVFVTNILLSTQVPAKYSDFEQTVVSERNDLWHMRGEPYLLLSLIGTLLAPINEKTSNPLIRVAILYLILWEIDIIISVELWKIQESHLLYQTLRELPSKHFVLNILERAKYSLIIYYVYWFL